jgi:hypothetical protein
MKMAAEEVVDKAADLLEVTADMGDAPGVYISENGALKVGLLVVAVAAGAGFIGYKVATKRLEAKYEELLKHEVSEAKQFYAQLHKKEGFSTPEEAVKHLRPVAEKPGKTIGEASEALRRYQGDIREEAEETEKEVVVERQEEVTVNVFTSTEPADPNFDPEAEERSPDYPYIISEEEWMQGEDGFTQTSITYWSGDGVLADEQEREIPFIDPIIGEGAIERFGHGTGDPNTVFVRNEKLSVDFEVTRIDGKYAHEVLGLEHSDGGSRGRQQRKQYRKIRGEDE